MCVYTLTCLYTHPFQITTCFKICKRIFKDIFCLYGKNMKCFNSGNLFPQMNIVYRVTVQNYIPLRIILTNSVRQGGRLNKVNNSAGDLSHVSCFLEEHSLTE